MIGHVSQAEKHPRDPRSSTAKPALDVKGLGQQHVFKDVSFSVWPGRIVTIIGTMGSGRESVCRALFGAEAFDEGILELNGRQIRSWSVSEAVHNGVGYLPAERKVEGMVGGLTAAENLTLTHPGKSKKGLFLSPKARLALAKEWFERLDVRPPDPKLNLERFSGGNQQKVVMAKWLTADNLKVLVLDHRYAASTPGQRKPSTPKSARLVRRALEWCSFPTLSRRRSTWVTRFL